MDVREKLADMLFAEIYSGGIICDGNTYKQVRDGFIKIADHLIAHGVMVQEWISIEAGELKNYIGAPVCIKRKTDGECWWAIIRGIKGDKVSTDYGGYFKLSECGETWIVKYLPLPQPPKGE